MTSKSGLGSLCSGLVQTEDGCEKLVKLVGRVVGRVEVNWKAVLYLLTISTELVPHADTAWHSLTSNMVRTGLEESDQESFLSGLLLARQAALCATPSFPSYSAWFHTSFGEEQTSLATPKRSHQFLVSQMTDLVPWEPAYTMKVHITRPPAVPNQIKELLEEYKSLAKTQLTALGEMASDAVQIANNRPSEEIFEQVINYVEEFSKSSKIPPSLVEASMFRKPFFSSQLLPALLLAKLDSGGMDAARAQMVELLNKKGKVPGPLYNSFISGEFRRTEPHEVKLPDEECTEENLTSCLGVLSHLTEPEDIKLVLGQVSYILRTVLRCRQGTGHNLSLSSVLSAGQNQLAAGLHYKILQTFLTGGSWRKDVLPLLTSSIPMLTQTMYFILSTSDFHELQVELLQFLRDTERSQLEVQVGKVMCVGDMLGSKYQPVTKYEQLEVIEKMLAGLTAAAGHSNWSAKTKHLENRRLCLAGADFTNCYDQFSLEDVRDVFELEAGIADKVDRLGQVQRFHMLHACAAGCSLSQYELAKCLLTTLLSVWDHRGTFPCSTLVMVQAVNKVVQSKVWLQLWRQEMVTSIADRMVTIFELVPGFMLESAKDVAPLVLSRNPAKFGVSLQLARLVLSSSSSSILQCPVVKASLAYWAARGSISMPASMQTGEMDPFWCWRMNKLDVASSARVGLILLAEEYLRGAEDIFSADNPVIKKLVTIRSTVGQEALESVLSLSPALWFPNVMSTMLTSSISLVLLLLSTSQPAVLPSSLQFCVLTLLPRLSVLLHSMVVQDWDLGQATMGMVRKLQEWQVTLVRGEVEKLEAELHPDLEDLLKQYLQ